MAVAKTAVFSISRRYTRRDTTIIGATCSIRSGIVKACLKSSLSNLEAKMGWIMVLNIAITAFSPPDPTDAPLSFRAPLEEFGFTEEGHSAHIIRTDLATTDEHFVFPRSAPRHPICRMAKLTAPFVSAAGSTIVNDLVWDKM